MCHESRKPEEPEGGRRKRRKADVRVIAGRFKGRRLVAPATTGTRPVTDRVKEAVFSSLGAEVEDARVLDLYAGAGSFGIEAASRGASSVTFVESGRKALEALSNNLASIDFPSEVVPADVERFITSANQQFDLVFCDPPWPLPSSEVSKILKHLADRVPNGGTVVVSRRVGDSVPQADRFEIADDRRYGDTRIIRYRRS